MVTDIRIFAQNTLTRNKRSNCAYFFGFNTRGYTIYSIQEKGIVDIYEGSEA